MNLPGTVYLEVTAGTEPGQLLGRLTFRGEDGSVYDEGDPVPLTAGTTLRYGPLWAEAHLGSKLEVGPTDQPKPPEKPAGPTPGKPVPPPPPHKR